MEKTINLFNAPVDLALASAEPHDLSQANAVGQGLDVFGRVSPDSFIMPLVDATKTTKKIFNFLGKDFLIPSYIIPIENPSGYYDGGTYTSREEFQNSIAANASASVGVGLFSGEMSAAYKNEFKSSSEYAYTYNNFYSSLALLELGDVKSAMRDSFADMVKKLPENVTSENLHEFVWFFNEFGIYYTDKVELGGSLEYYVSVKKSSEMSETEISAMMKAQYNGLFVSGSVSAEVKKTEAWKKYTSHTQFHIFVTGGDPALAGALTGIDPLNPSSATVGAYTAWLKTVSKSPAITNMKLAGIWMLCGSKSKVVQQAWTLYSSTIHPKITIETYAQITPWPIPSKIVTPIITLNGSSVKPSVQATSPVGWQAIILSNDGNTPQVLYNKYFSLDSGSYSWSSKAYKDMYAQMTRELSSTEHYKKGNIFLLVSFGMGNNCVPRDDFYEYMKLNGGGEILDKWRKFSHQGSQAGNPNVWMVGPLNYALVSNLNFGPHVGLEVLQHAQVVDKHTVNTQILLYLFKDSVNGRYNPAI